MSQSHSNACARRSQICQVVVLGFLLPLAACGGGGGNSGSGGSNPPPSQPPVVRTRYVRTDATTEYFGWVNQHWMLYHAATGRYFLADTSSNQIIVIDAATQSEVGTIAVPGAFGMDDTPDHSTIYVGTQIGDVYAVDPVAMTVTKRYIASQIGNEGFLTGSVLVLADGRLALIGPYNGIDGTPSIRVWNPADNSISPPYSCVFTNIGGFARTVDRTLIFLGMINGGGWCELDPNTGAGSIAANGSASALMFTTTPDGKYVILPNYPSGVIVYDVKTLATVAQFNVQGGFYLVSPDSKTLFVLTDTIIYAYSLTTQQLTGWAPNIFIVPTSGGFAFGPIDSPFLQATDGSGLYAGPMEEGVGFVDLSALQHGNVGTQFTNGYLDPATGPTSGGTATQWTDPNPVGGLKSIYFGSHQATNISFQSGYIKATSPAGNVGPADVYTFTNDGGMQILPEAFSYGPTILEVTPNTATAEGGGTGYVYGYGFGPIAFNGIPSDLKVTVAGVGAQVTAFNWNAYNLAAPPFPLQSVAFTIPAGTSGTSVDVSVSTNSGSATASKALAYLPSIQQFPRSGSSLVQGIYDPYTDLYYFTDSTKIQVFSRTQGKWLSPISISGAQRLWGIALSPDGSKLAVSDATAGNIYLVDPANPTSMKTFFVGAEPGGAPDPCGVAISDSGIVYYVTIGTGIGGAHQFYKLNTNNGQITDYGIDGTGIVGDAGLRNVISADNARVYYNDDGFVFAIDTASDKMFPAADGYGCCYGNYELALSSNQTRLTGTFYIYDSDLNGESYYAMNDRELLNILNTLYVYGAKLSPDGRLLFQPSTNGIDVFDGRLGNLRERISLPISLSENYDALVADGKDNILVAITGTNGNGIALVDLTSILEPPPLSYDNDLFTRPRMLSEVGARLHNYSVPRSSKNQNDRPISPIRAVRHRIVKVR